MYIYNNKLKFLIGKIRQKKQFEQRIVEDILHVSIAEYLVHWERLAQGRGGTSEGLTAQTTVIS